ncbi:hypothetical protein ACFL9T_09840 [Thermodesulfobacteriota bacterium]
MPVKKKPQRKKLVFGDSKICFLISPIGKEGTEVFNKFKEIHEYVIKPAVKNTDYDLQVIRADEIDRSGSFIKDILESLLSSFIVIADLTNQNPNVFYELGVRHSLSPRTILIAQSMEEVPSDLREYRTIVYDNTAKGLKLFSDRLKNYIQDIHEEPNRPDNPVLDRLGGIIDERTLSLENQVSELKSELNSVLTKGTKPKTKPTKESAYDRIRRIYKLKSAVKQEYISLSGNDGTVIFHEGDDETSIQLTVEQGNFELYFIMSKGIIADYWYVSAQERDINLEKELADIRVLLENCLDKNDIEFKFIIATNDDLSTQKENLSKSFKKMLSFIKKDSRKLFSLLIWDDEGLLSVEKELGLRVEF